MKKIILGILLLQISLNSLALTPFQKNVLKYSTGIVVGWGITGLLCYIQGTKIDNQYPPKCLEKEDAVKKALLKSLIIGVLSGFLSVKLINKFVK